MTQLRFDGQVIVVTGGAGGLGRSQALDFAARGARVVVNDLGGSPLGGGADASLAAAVVAEITSAGGQALASTDSVATSEGAEQIVAAALDTWGRLDALVTNAGIQRSHHIEDIPIDVWDEVMRINIRGVFCTAQAAYRVMLAQGFGRIVNITSNAGLCGAFGMTHYATSKAAVIGLTKSFAWEGQGAGIKVNAVAPAAFDTRMAMAGLSEPAAVLGRPPALEITGDLSYLPVVTSAGVTPMVVALAHGSCAVSGEIFGAFGGHYCRYITSQTNGAVPSLEPRAEDVIDNWDRIRSSVGARELAEEMMLWMNRNGSELLARRAELESVPTA